MPYLSPEFYVDGTTIPDVDWDIGPSWSGLLPISGAANETRKVSKELPLISRAPRAHATTRLISRLETTSPRCVAPPCAFNSSSSGSSHLGHRAPWTTSSSGTSAFPDLLSQSSRCGCDALRPGERRAPGAGTCYAGHHLTTFCANIIAVQDQRWPGVLFARGPAAGERGACYGTPLSVLLRS